MIFPFVGLFFVGLYLLHGKQMLSGDKGIWLEWGRSLGGRWKLIRGGRCRTRWELRLGVFMDGFPSEPLPPPPRTVESENGKIIGEFPSGRFHRAGEVEGVGSAVLLYGATFVRHAR